MLFQHKGCFELKAIEKKQAQEKLSALSFFTRKGRKSLNPWRQL